MNFLITGVSSGIGRELTKQLIERGHKVYGVARRKKLLLDLQKELKKSPNFYFSVMDVSSALGWKKLIISLQKAHYKIDCTIFNAGIYQNDLEPDIESQITRKQMEINFFGVILGVESLLKYLKKGQFIAISSSSSFKGNANEGVGYGASKAALSVAFESLYLKFKNSPYLFKTVFLGPVGTSMLRKKRSFITKSVPDTAEYIINSINQDKRLFYYPFYLFFLLKLIKNLPQSLYFKILSFIS